ncbi:class IIb bacteriocin, lactobin A/cerein 7B family [Burkholderia sp. YIM B11467]
MQVLSENEIRNVSGGLGPVGMIPGALGGLAMYAGGQFFSSKPMTWQGAAWAAGTGAAVGATGGALMVASGGGLAANLAWRPGMAGTNLGLGQYSGYKGW